MATTITQQSTATRYRILQINHIYYPQHEERGYWLDCKKDLTWASFNTLEEARAYIDDLFKEPIKIVHPYP